MKKWEPKFKVPADAKQNPFGLDYEGFLSWRNARNGFVVAAVHYTSDPDKRSEEWFRETTKQMRPDQIDREMEINFESRAGQKAFGYLLDEPARWRIANMDYREIPRNWRIIASLDYGTTNPTAIYFWAIDNKRRMYSIYEFYKPSNVREIAKVLKGIHRGPNLDGVETDYRHPLWKRCEKVVVDGAIFNKNQENGDEGMVSVGDLLEEQGIYTMERATKDRVAGLARFHDMLAPSIVDPEQAPSLYFTKKCVHLWKELTELVYDELPPHLLLNKNQKEDIVAKNDHCFVAGTLISSPSGKTPIERIKSGDVVFTRSGPRTVEAAGPTEIAQTYELKFSNGAKLVCTANHPIWTENRGFIRADELRYSDTIVSEEECQKKRSNLTELFSGVIHNLKIKALEIISCAARSFLTVAFASCTEKFGSNTMAQSPMVTTFITKTETRLITTHRILSAFLDLTTSASTERGAQPRKEQHGKLIENSRQNGMVPETEKIGTKNMEKRFGKIAPMLRNIVSFVAQNSRRERWILRGQNSAPISAGPRIVAKWVLTILISLARFAQKLLQRTDTLSPPLAAGFAVRLKERCRAEIAQVYNLRVCGLHEYYANGILVHNSYDAARYAIMAIQAPSEEMPPDEPEAGSLAEEEALIDKEDADEGEIDYL